MQIQIIDLSLTLHLTGLSKTHDPARSYGEELIELLNVVWETVNNRGVLTTGINHAVYDEQDEIFAGVEITTPDPYLSIETTSAREEYNRPMLPEIYISVDVETAGPTPAQYALLSIGACLVDEPSRTFYVELQPDRIDFTPQAMAIGGFSLEALKESGVHPKDAMQAFADWVKSVVLPGQRPVFVAFNAPFDWSFINDYFYRYLGENPFGHSALDIKAYYMGLTGVTWAETSMQLITAHILEEKHLSHNALSDAQDQAEIFRLILGITSRWWSDGARRVMESDSDANR